jgi:glutaredoxin
MGRITIFVKDSCRFCDTVKHVIAEAVREVESELARADEATEAEQAAPQSGAAARGAADTAQPLTGPRFDVSIINISRHPERAPQCKALSGGAHTVPQVFFNDVYVGNCSTCETFHRKGELVAKLRQCKHG